MNIRISHINWAIQRKQIIKSISMNIKQGEIIGIVGPNGSGKSTLLRLVYRFYTPKSGVIFINERDISKLSGSETAQQIAVVTQERDSDFDFTVQEIVMMGRTPHKRLFDHDNDSDRRIVLNALRKIGAGSLLKRKFNTLSGGEKQRILIARSLAQKTKILILDEPTNHLDLRYQFEIMKLIRSLKITVIATMHDLNLASTFCDRVYLLNKGEIVSQGQPQEVFSKKLIKDVYGVNAEVRLRQSDGRLSIDLYQQI